jgi:polyhydroxybutyrate depolymerase
MVPAHPTRLAPTRLALAAAIAATLGLAPAHSPGEDAQPARQSFMHNGTLRGYVVRAPNGARSAGARLPVVLVLHGGGGNADNAERMTGFTQLVEREHIMVVYPEGTSARAFVRLLTWNAGHCCGYAMENRIDDVGFIDALLDTLAARYPVDTARIFVTGMSNGAMMSHRLGRELSHRIAGIAPVVGALFGDELPPSQPVSAIMINGLLDKSVPADGGATGGRSANAWDGVPTAANIAQGTYWARADGCAATPTVQERATSVTRRWECPAGRRVELHQLKDQGHAWPSGQRGSRLGDKPSTSMDATEVIWAFFASVRKQ